MLRGLKHFSLPGIEKQVLERWRAGHAFDRSLTKNRGKRRFVFYEGPPTANGRPGIHHVLARAFKDIIPRYKTMQGFHVSRKGGWDTHGLPVELEVEKELGLASKAAIERYGIAAFNKRCRTSVWKYQDEWERLTERIGFWLDLKDPYITYSNAYIETLWWILKRVWQKRLLYRGHKVVPWCTRCGTALSSHEMALGYKEITDQSVYVKFRLKLTGKVRDGYVIKGSAAQSHTGALFSLPTYLVSWTTTPWTLPGNVALAVGKHIDYVFVRREHEQFIVAKDLLEKVFGGGVEIVATLKGKELLGLKYEPPFKVKKLEHKNAYTVYGAGFVTTTDGTGVVHTAVMYGEDDYSLGKEVDLPQHHTVDERGRFTRDVPGFAGMSVKDPKVEDRIIRHLETNGHLLKIEPYTHEYPFCWRCSTPLLYYARDSWFIAMRKLRPRLLRANRGIRWVPDHLRNGRFGGWLREVKDWAISRERYWGTPLPIWSCQGCGAVEMFGSFAELADRAGSSTNRYILVRHGQAESNLRRVASGWPEQTKHHLTLFGRVEVERLARRLAKERVDVIYASDLTRTKETEQVLADAFRGERVFFDARLREINTGDFNGCHDTSYHAYYSSDLEKFTKRPPKGESLTDLRTRVYAFLGDLERKHRGKTIVVVSHEYPIWMMEAMMRGWGNEEAVREKRLHGKDFIRTAEGRVVPMRHVPRDETGLMDVHRPYIDEVVFPCAGCNGRMQRVPEVVDVWFDSGAMPFAQAHWPFEKVNGKQLLDFPADYIAEAVDQTRGWFYTLLAVAVLLGKGKPYRNVISLGHMLDRSGQKMSKSKGNVVDPWALIERYGADTIRWYCYTVNQPGEPKRFDEGDLAKVLRQFILLIYHSFVFYDTYTRGAGLTPELPRLPRHALDRWVLARLRETVAVVTERLDQFDVGEAARTIEAFAGDLSRWYIRRSRRRFQQPTSVADHRAAQATLGHVLSVLARLMAPFTPFLAEALYRSVAPGRDASVHLEDWPKARRGALDQKLFTEMDEVRRVVSLALAERASAGIRVRQPLRELRLKSSNALRKNRALLEILKDEVNVKTVVFPKGLRKEVELDTTLTHELREEGLLREFLRIVQDLRQDAGLRPRDRIELMVVGVDELRHVLVANEPLLKREVGASAVAYQRSDKVTVELQTKLEGQLLWVGIRKR